MIASEVAPDEQLSALLSSYPPEIGTLAKRCLRKLRRSFPGGYELVYDYSSSLVVAFGMSERGSQAIVAMKISPQRVQLHVDRSLPDPERLLEGSGIRVRGVTIGAASDLDHGP